MTRSRKSCSLNVTLCIVKWVVVDVTHSGVVCRNTFVVLVLATFVASGAAQPLVFLGDRHLRPFKFLDNGQGLGASVDLAMAVGRELGLPVEMRLMDREDAQIPAAVKPQLEPAASPGEAGAARRILVVDDNVDAAQTLATMLRMGGHQVAIAHAGQNAVKLAAALQPEIVFLDLGLPDIDGLEVCRRLRRTPCATPMTIVALTGWGRAEDLQRTADGGFDGHLTKPVEPRAFEQWLARAQSVRPGTTPLRADALVLAASGAPG